MLCNVAFSTLQQTGAGELYRFAIIEFGQLILKGMDQHSLHAGVQGKGCQLLGRLIESSAGQRLIWSNSIDVILNAMQQHDQNKDVQSFGCHTLYKLVCSNTGTSRRVICEANCISPIEQATQKFPDLHWSCKPLLKLLQDSRFAADILAPPSPGI